MGLKLEIGRNANNAMQRMGISSECVAQAVHSPDDVHKIIPTGCDQHDWPIFSLYIKRFSNGMEESLLLVQALKEGGTLKANAVWQIYPSDIGIEEETSALDVFKAFLDKYGVHLKTACGLTKMVMYQIIASTTTTQHGKWQRTFNLPEGVFDAEDYRVTRTPEVCSNKWVRQLNVKMHVAMLYTINVSNYLHDLASHHVAAT